MNNTTHASRYGFIAKSASILLSASLLVSTFTCLGGVFAAPKAEAATDYGLADNIQDGTILHCFDWKYTDIIAELPNIAEAGFTSVQTSPAQPDGTGTWYWLYQPKGFYAGTNGLGTKDQLATLCSEAEKYGIKVVVDVVANHLNGQTSSVQSDLQDSQYWHTYGTVSDWNDRYQVIYGEIGMRDLATENTYVQSKVKGYVEELKGLGVDGIRWDAAKHIGLPGDGQGQFWPTVTSVGLWNYGEILDNPGGDPEKVMKEYTNYISITDAGYGHTLRDAQRQGKVPTGYANWAARGLTSDKIVYWGESHDTWANAYDWGYSHDMSQNQIDRCYAIVAARNLATSLYFSRPFSNPSAKENTHIGEKGSTHFTAKEVAEVNKFHNAMIGKKDYYAANSDGSACAVTRQDGGAVIVKGSGSGSVTVENGGSYVPAGTYTDHISGNTFTVTSSTISGNVGDSGIAVIYEGGSVVKSAKVSATPESSSFTTSVTATLSVSNAASGTYSTSDGQSGTYTNGKTITFGANTAIGGTVTLTLKATGEDGVEKTATYTYTKKDPNAVTTIYFDNSSYKWSTVYAYVYNDSSSGGGGSSTTSGSLIFSDSLGWGSVNAYFFSGTTSYSGSWPGTAMTKTGTNEYNKGQYTIAIPSGATSVVFNNGSAQSVDVTLSNVTGYYCTSEQENGKYKVGTWTSTGSSASTVTENAAWPGVQMTLDASTGYYMYEVPDNLVNGRVIFTEGKSSTNRYPADKEAGLAIEDTTKLFSAGNSWKAYTPVKPVPVPDVPTVTSNKASGTSFTTETMDITLTLSNAVSGTYTVDNGPTKTFTGSKTVTIGEGKIGDSTVTVVATAKDSSGTEKSYTFTYDKKYVKTTSSSAGTLTSYYSTNKAGKGANKTISVDGDKSDWDSSMIIAQGTANDDPRVYRPNSMYELPLDLYTLYGAYDDNNVYLMWEMTNVQDVVAPNDNYPLSQGILWQTQELPFFIAVDTGKSDAIGNNGKTTTGGTIWDSGITFKNSFNRLISINTKGGNGPFVYAGDSTGLNPVEVLDAKTSNIKMNYGKGILSANVYGINGAYGESNNRVVGDMCSDSSAWVDFNTKGHSSATMDFFYELSIPYSELGITKNDVTTNGIGVLLIMTSGKSGMDCLPYDLSMNDQADLDDAAGSQENNSFEKSDEDFITTGFARIGAGESGNNNGGGSTTTTPLQVNFGADRSAPQLTTTALTLKAVGYGGTAPYTYKFLVDGAVVKADNSTATYTWKPGSAKTHTISCVITDSTGATATVTKNFTAEGENVVSTLANNTTVSKTNITVGEIVTVTGAASGGTSPYTYQFYYKRSTASTWTRFGSNGTGKFQPGSAGTFTIRAYAKDSAGGSKVKDFTITATESNVLTNNTTVSKTNIRVGEIVTVTGAASGGTKPYTYQFYYKRSTASSWTRFGSNGTGKFQPGSAGKFTIRTYAKDNAGGSKVKDFTITATESTVLTNNTTVSKTNITVGEIVTVTGAASGGTKPYTYQFYYKRSTASTWTRFGSNGTGKFQPGSAGTFTIRTYAKDNAGGSKVKDFTITAKDGSSTSTALANKTTVSTTNFKVGTTVKVTGAATGGSGSYTFEFYYKRSTASSWTRFGSNGTGNFKPGSAGTFTIRTYAKDTAGATSVKDFTLTATN